MNRNIIIAWNVYHTRNESLAIVFELDKYHIGKNERKIIKSILSYPYKIYKTIVVLYKVKPEKVIVTNTAFLLPLTVFFIKVFLCRFKLILDTHSGGIENKMIAYPLALRKLFARKADLNIITNTNDEQIVRKWGGKTIVLPDPPIEIQAIDNGNIDLNNGMINIVYINTYSDDEPYEQVIDAFNDLPDNYCLYITGKLKHRVKNTHRIVHTDYLEKDDYRFLISNADILMVLTTRENTFQCGANEALSLEKPLIISNTAYLKSYYGDSVVFTDNSSSDIKEKIIFMSSRIEFFARKMIEQKQKVINDMNLKKEQFKKIV